MRKASISDLKNKLSAFLDLVRAGESVLVLDRDAPIAIIEPVRERGGDARAMKLERAGLMRRPARRSALDLAALRAPAPKSSASVLEALIEERRAGR